ncbi:hypothetical protein DMUE_0108 [Dictyocoela muelleri]|nr:hypothetical protein DMUE_0108 [Dictyocoela muelleri]
MSMMYPYLYNKLFVEKNLQFDSGISSAKRYIIFFSDEFRGFIKTLKIVVIDDTFMSFALQLPIINYTGVFLWKVDLIHFHIALRKDRTCIYECFFLFEKT